MNNKEKLKEICDHLHLEYPVEPVWGMRICGAISISTEDLFETEDLERFLIERLEGVKERLYRAVVADIAYLEGRRKQQRE